MEPGVLRLEGQTAIVTGAGSGIGQASAVLFAAHGAAVACVDIDDDGAAETVATIGKAGGRAVAIHADVRFSDETERMVAEARAELGDIDVLYNNVGLGVHKQVHELGEDEWNLTMDSSLKSVYLGSKAILPHFLAQGRGVIINTASSLGLLVTFAHPAYSAAKAGVIQLTKAMALDYGPTIRVNCICPGAVETAIVHRNPHTEAQLAARAPGPHHTNKALQRMAEPIEIAEVALFLASSESSFCTGAAIVVDGGQTIDL